METYTLFNKYVPILNCTCCPQTGSILDIQEVFHPEAAPPGLKDCDGKISRKNLETWWKHRHIPASRDHFPRDLDPDVLAIQSMGFSLSD